VSAIHIPTADRSGWLNARTNGIGSSDIAAIVGESPYATAFDVYASKTGLFKPEDNPSPRMLMGKKVERFIAELYAEETGKPITWLDTLHRHPAREWQLFTPDFIRRDEEIGGDAKNVAADQAWKWGTSDSRTIPAHIEIQAQWMMSGFNWPQWDIAGFFGGNDFRVSPVYRDAEVEGLLLEAGERFWKDNVLKRVPPALQVSDATKAYLAKRFPENKGKIRKATEEESYIIEDCKVARIAFELAEETKGSIENQIKQLIGDDDGIEVAGGKVTWKRCQDTMGTDWEAIARGLLSRYGTQTAELIIKLHGVVAKKGSRRFGWWVK
jgi:putative phage-type endonuclease